MNIEYVVGIVIYNGYNTKIMQNNIKPIYKFSKLEKLINKTIIATIMIQIFLVIIGIIFGTKWINDP